MTGSFRDIIAWQKSHSIVLEVYKIKFPKEEMFGIQSQIRRAAISVPNNIAEGSGRRTNKEMLQFLIISRGSLEETRYLIQLSKGLDYINLKNYQKVEDLAIEASKVLNGLIKAIKTKINS